MKDQNGMMDLKMKDMNGIQKVLRKMKYMRWLKKNIRAQKNK